MYSVELTQGAEQDLEAIYDYIAENDCVENANYLLDELLSATASLAEQPERGSYPKELIAIGIKEYRQVLFKPYRLIYRIQGARVIVFVIADGRRDFQSLLEQRLLAISSN